MLPALQFKAVAAIYSPNAWFTEGHIYDSGDDSIAAAMFDKSYLFMQVASVRQDGSFGTSNHQKTLRT